MRAASIRKASVNDVARFFRSPSLPVHSFTSRTVTPLATIHRPVEKHKRLLTNKLRNMASFSNTDTGSKPADPYKEKNLQEPELKDKVEDLVKFVDHCKFGMMTTRIASNGLLTSRCMALAAKEGGGVDLLFHTNTESGKTDDLQSDPKINIAFLNSTGEWASISGEASIVTDRELVRKYYSSALKAWLGDLEDGKHDGGPEDPRIGVIKVIAKTATYAISEGTIIGRGGEIAKGVITGSAPKVNKLREISEQELEQWRSQKG